MDDKERRLTAAHESGHALVMLATASDPVHKVTIIPRGQALGSTMQLPEKERYTESREKLLNIITSMMGGRAAEEVVFGDVTTGAQMDFRQATHIARMMVCEWGMSPALGPQSFGEREELLFLGREVARSHHMSEETARKIDAEVSRILNERHDEALRILRERRAALDALTEALLERETLDGREVEEIVRLGRKLNDEERAALAATPAAAPETGTPG